jgi:hypothetical protein
MGLKLSEGFSDLLKLLWQLLGVSEEHKELLRAPVSFR